jgi:hypothetical protein
MVRIFHSNDRIHPPEVPDQFLYKLLFALCLVLPAAAVSRLAALPLKSAAS